MHQRTPPKGGDFPLIGFLLKSFEDTAGTSFGEINENSAASGDEVPVAGEFGDRCDRGRVLNALGQNPEGSRRTDYPH